MLLYSEKKLGWMFVFSNPQSTMIFSDFLLAVNSHIPEHVHYSNQSFLES